MNSNLACIGMDVDEAGLSGLLADIAPRSELLGTVDGDRILAWPDGSGARLIFSVRDGEVVDVLPSYAGGTEWPMNGCHMLNPSVVTAGVFGPGGDQITALTFAPEQHRFLRTRRRATDAPTRLVGLGFDVQVFDDATAFSQARESLLVMDGADDGPRLGAGSFLSYGVWDEPDVADAYARIGGVVVHAETLINQATGQRFSVARVRVLEFALDVCLPGEVPLPEPGQVVAGMVYLVGALNGVPYGTGRPGG